MAILKESQLDIISHGADQTKRLGLHLGRLLEPGDTICLAGDIGAGKTVFSSGIGEGWGADMPVTSPTFNLIHQHTREQDSQLLYHFDCYRLQSSDEAEWLGVSEIFESNQIAVIEWPEHIQDLLPEECLWVDIRIVEPTRRNFVFQPNGERYIQRLRRFREGAYGV